MAPRVSHGKTPVAPAKRAAAAKGRDRRSLGEGVRRLRRQRGWTLAELSAKTGLAISTLSKVENDQISLTYHNLAKLASGMDLDIADFFGPEPPGGARGRQALCRRGAGPVHETANYAHEYLCAGLPGRQMVPLCSRVKARSLEAFGETIAHPGDEFIYVLEGAIDLHVGGGRPVRLRAGDSYYFDGRAGHAAVSVGIGDALILTVISNLSGREER
jgi:transcriptional regulator with XRE-family HTH domain/mannose-6-phosphate isomerase-like protein (cupin superfamily)